MHYRMHKGNAVSAQENSLLCCFRNSRLILLSHVVHVTVALRKLGRLVIYPSKHMSVMAIALLTNHGLA